MPRRTIKIDRERFARTVVEAVLANSRIDCFDCRGPAFFPSEFRENPGLGWCPACWFRGAVDKWVDEESRDLMAEASCYSIEYIEFLTRDRFNA